MPTSKADALAQSKAIGTAVETLLIDTRAAAANEDDHFDAVAAGLFGPSPTAHGSWCFKGREAGQFVELTISLWRLLHLWMESQPRSVERLKTPQVKPVMFKPACKIQSTYSVRVAQLMRVQVRNFVVP